MMSFRDDLMMTDPEIFLEHQIEHTADMYDPFRPHY